MTLNKRLPAEWESHALTQITWPSANTDWNYMLDEVRECYVSLASEILKREPLLIVTDDVEGLNEWIDVQAHHNLYVVVCDINDTWARDHGFITLQDGDSAQLLDFQFNGWGLKFASCYDNQINANLWKSVFNLPRNSYVSKLNIVLEGGSVESDGRGSILSTAQCILAPNRNVLASDDEATRLLCDNLAASRVLWLHHGYLAGDDTDSHVDTLARMAPHDSIVYVKASDPADEHTPELILMEEELRQFRTIDGKPYRLVALPMTPPMFDPVNGDRLPATYANFYFVNGAILLPVYDVDTDGEAVRIMTEAFPDFEVVPVNCRALIRQHGSLHCSTMQFPAFVGFHN